MPCGENSRGIGPAEMAQAIRQGRPNRASAELALHVLDVIECMMESTKTGAFVDVKTTCSRPEAANWGKQIKSLKSRVQKKLIVFSEASCYNEHEVR